MSQMQIGTHGLPAAHLAVAEEAVAAAHLSDGQTEQEVAGAVILTLRTAFGINDDGPEAA